MMADRKKVEPLLKTARGQIDGVLKMIEDNRYCMDIMMQLQAVESLVHKAQREGLRGHLSGCVQDAFETGDQNEREQKIAEITGAKCKETWLTGQTAQEAVGTLIAGGEYPDMIDGGDGMKQLYDAGALVALDDYIDKYPNIKEFLTDEEWDKLRQDDGHIYWINQFGNIYGEEKQPPTVTRHSGSRREC